MKVKGNKKRKQNSKIKAILNKRQDQLTIGESMAISAVMLAAVGMALIAPIAAIGFIESHNEKKNNSETTEEETPKIEVETEEV